MRYKISKRKVLDLTLTYNETMELYSLHKDIDEMIGFKLAIRKKVSKINSVVNRVESLVANGRFNNLVLRKVSKESVLSNAVTLKPTIHHLDKVIQHTGDIEELDLIKSNIFDEIRYNVQKYCGSVSLDLNIRSNAKIKEVMDAFDDAHKYILTETGNMDLYIKNLGEG